MGRRGEKIDFLKRQGNESTLPMGSLGEFYGTLLWGIIQGNDSTLPMGPLGEFFKELSFGE